MLSLPMPMGRAAQLLGHPYRSWLLQSQVYVHYQANKGKSATLKHTRALKQKCKLKP